MHGWLAFLLGSWVGSAGGYFSHWLLSDSWEKDAPTPGDPRPPVGSHPLSAPPPPAGAGSSPGTAPPRTPTRG